MYNLQLEKDIVLYAPSQAFPVRTTGLWENWSKVQIYMYMYYTYDIVKCIHIIYVYSKYFQKWSEKFGI